MLRDRCAGKKVITLEVLLPAVSQYSDLFTSLKPFREYIDALNVPSNPLGRLRPDALCSAYLLQEKSGIEAIPHFVARHLTSLSFESHLLGAAALGIQNILCVTGDSPVEGRSMFELNASKLLNIANNLRHGLTSSRTAIERVDFCLCAGFNPNVPNIYGEYVKAREKCRCGAEVFFTQPIFNAEQFLSILKEFRAEHKHVRVIAGLSFLYTKKRAFSLMKFLGIPHEYIQWIEERDETEMLFETARALKDYVDGFYVIPIAKYPYALELVRKIRALY